MAQVDCYLDEEILVNSLNECFFYLSISSNHKKELSESYVFQPNTEKMIEKGFDFVTIASDLRALSAGAKATVDKMKGSLSKKDNDATY